MKHLIAAAWLPVALFALVASAQAQTPINFTVKAEPATVKPGGKAKLIVTAVLDSGWHLYALTQAPPPKAIKISLDDNPNFTQDGNPGAPKGKVAFDPNFQIETETYEGTVNFTLPVRARAEAPAGPQKIAAKVSYQVCNDRICHRPTTKSFETDIVISDAPAAKASTSPLPAVSASPTAKPSPSPSPTPSSSPVAALALPTASPSAAAAPISSASPPPPSGTPSVAELKSRGLFGYVWFAIISGLLALLTPCVFPMVPITVSYFTKREQNSRGQAIGHAIIYALGIVFTFTGLGLVMTLIAGAAGINKIAANPWLNIFLTLLFATLALNLFGLFEIRMPTGLISNLDKKSQNGGIGATLLMGLVFTLTSFTCTVAFVGQVLVFATQGEWFWSIIGMLAFSSAFAFPFFLLSVFPHWLKSLPSSGGWMNSVKVIMGFVELAAAFKFLSNADLVWGWNTVSRNLVLSAWIAIAIVAAIYLLGKIQLPMDSPVKSLGVIRMLLAVFFFGLAFYFLTGLMGGNLGGFEAMLPPATSGPVAFRGKAAEEQWLNSYDKAIELARTSNKPVFLNFTGVTCTNCRWMESNVLSQTEVKKALENFVLAELYTDRQTPEDERHSQLQEKNFGTVALPLYVVIGPDGHELSKFPGLTRDKMEFVRFIEEGAARFQSAKRS